MSSLSTLHAASDNPDTDSPRQGPKVLFSTGSLFDQSSGPFASLFGTIQALSQAGCSSMVLGSRGYRDILDPTFWGGQEVHAFRRIGPYSWHWTPGLPAFLKRCRFQVASIQGIWQVSSGMVSRHCIHHGIPYMVTPHGMLNKVALAISPFKKRVASSLYVRSMLREASCIHALNNAEHDAIRLLGFSNPICVLSNGVSASDILQGKPSNIREKTVLYLGRLHPIKGLDLLIEAWASTRGAAAGWRLRIAGPSSGDTDLLLKKLARNLSASDSIEFVGPVFGAAKKELLGAASWFVLPSRSEGFPMTPLESLACGTPVVITPECNLPEVIADGAGIDAGSSVDSLKRSLIQAMTMPTLAYTKMVESAGACLRHRFSWSKIASELLAVFQWMAGYRDEPKAIVRRD